MFKAGDVVKNKLNSKTATVLEVLANGMIRVRFDGTTEAVILHPSRFDLQEVHPSSPPSGPPEETFKKGDYIQITDTNGETKKGAALDDINVVGLAVFDMLTDEGEYLRENANYVQIQVLFRADIARGQMPKY